MTPSKQSLEKARGIMSASYRGQGIGWLPTLVQEHLALALDAERDAVLEEAANVAFDSFGTCGECVSNIGHGIRALKREL